MTQLSDAELIIEQDVMIPMRDGVRLQADIYRPAAPGRYPVLLSRTPYGRRGRGRPPLSPQIPRPGPARDTNRFFVSQGYVIVNQDCRGRYGSEGNFYLVVSDAEDGYDTVEWAAVQPWSNGNVGAFGQSYPAVVQYALAPLQPPHLKALVPISAPSDYHESWGYHTGGAFELGWFISYTIFLGFEMARRAGASADYLQQLENYLTPYINFAQPLTDEWYRHLPLSDWSELLKEAAPHIADYLNNPNDGPYWWSVNLRRRYHQVDVPMYQVTSWYDIFQEGALHSFMGVRALGTERARQSQKLVVGPWGHLFPYTTPITGGCGELDFGDEAAIDLMEEQLRWFDYWLKGIDTGIMDEPPVKIFVMGENRWRNENEWPLARTQYTPYYLHSRGSANTFNGDGWLSPEAPEQESPDHFVYDPRDPVPTLGGNTQIIPVGVYDQRPVEARPDVLVYTSDVLNQDVEVTGPIIVNLYAASSAYDTDFTAKLVDVRPDGYAQNIQDGIIRARYRDSSANPTLITPEQVHHYTIDLWATSHVFKAGHRIRVEVSSSNFPRFDRNPNTGNTIATEAQLISAYQTILHDAQHPSHIRLPVIPR